MTLLEELSNKDFLFDAWKQLNKENEYSHGLSGTSIKDFKQNLVENIFVIKHFLDKGKYEFSKNRAAVLKKDNGKYRPLQIPEIRDRVVLKALAILLEDNLSELLNESEGISFAYQKGKGVQQAVLKMKSIFDDGKNVILKADIVNFFEEVNKDSLINNIIFPNLRDDSINFLISASLNQKLGGLNRLKKEHRAYFKNVGKGIPQGNPLSPLLSNIYLADFDRFMKNQGNSMVRYADDFIVLFDSIENAHIGYNQIKKYLNNELSLDIHELGTEYSDKTIIVNPVQKKLSFLSIRFDGESLRPPSNSIPILKSKIAREVKLGNLDQETFNSIYQLINNWIARYSYLDIERYFDSIDEHLKLILKKKFNRNNIKTTKCWEIKTRYFNEKGKKKKKPFWRRIFSSRKPAKK